MSRRTHIGFDRRIDLAWLDAVAAQAAAGVPADALRASLWDLLDGAVSGDQVNSARGKTVTVLNHLWGEVPASAVALRERAAAEFSQANADERLALHWAMMVGTYPVFTDTAAAIGRLLALQGSFTLAHLTRRLVGVWGERSTLQRATQRIVRSMVQWGVLRDTDAPGSYEAATRGRTLGSTVAALLVEALLIDAEESAVPLGQLTGHPALFPFKLELSAGQVRNAGQFQVHRQGLDTDFVELWSKKTGA